MKTSRLFQISASAAIVALAICGQQALAQENHRWHVPRENSDSNPAHHETAPSPNLYSLQAALVQDYPIIGANACTTHYSCCTELAKLAPRAKVLENRLYVEDGECYSSAGITAGIDLMLHIVSQLTDQSCAVAVARYLVVYLRRSGTDPQLSPWLDGPPRGAPCARCNRC